MKVLLIGGGGREHALAYKIKQSKLLTELKVYPGNAGFSSNEIIPKDSFNLKNKDSVQSFIKKEKFKFVVIGPEDPLVDGVVDWMDEIGILCFGPSKYCSQLEGSKEFAKEKMKEYQIPTAKYAKFTDYESSIRYVNSNPLPLVVKYDGLAAGKGVTVCFTKVEVETSLADIFLHKKFGSNSTTVLIEEFMDGEEASIFALCDGEKFLMFPAAQDHKRAYDGDKGPNTGGMGAYAPAPIATDKIYEQVKNTIFKPMIDGLKKNGTPYKGLLYAGLMIDKNGYAKVVEFNCRFGDPETQCLMTLLNSDLLELMIACAKGDLGNKDLKIKNQYSVVVVVAADGYPNDYKKGIHLELPNVPNNITIFHAGTSIKDNKLVSNGGRILGITSIQDTLKKSVDSIYSYLKIVKIPNVFYRQDIAKKAL